MTQGIDLINTINKLNEYFKNNYSNDFVAFYDEDNDSIKICVYDNQRYPVLIIGDYEYEGEYEINTADSNVRVLFIKEIMNIIESKE